MRSGRVCLDVCEIQVQRDEYSAFRATALEEHEVIRSRKVLLGDGCRFEACLAKNQSTFRGEIFVDFELQAVVSSGRSTVPSRANSAA
jgi:hypothetical protein